MLSGVEKALLAVLVLVLMTGMGATLEVRHFREVMHKPKGVLVGLASQFGWMPLLAFGFAKALGLPSDLAIGLVIVGCTPGGTTSNLFTYYARADLALSISMTAMSTLVAVVAMPLLLLLYATPFSQSADSDLVVPYGSIVKTLVVVLLPVAIGMTVRAKKPPVATKLETIGSVAGVATLILLVGSSLLRNGHLLAQTSLAMFTAAIGLGALGLGLGYLASRALRMPKAQCRAVSFETGIQNSPLAFAIIIASFPSATHSRLLWLPLLYALFVLITASVVTTIYSSRDRRTSREA